MTRNLAIYIAIISILAALALAPATPAQAFDTVYVTRHADKYDPAPYRAAGHDELTPLSRRGMERAEALGGSLRIDSSPGAGTQVVLEIRVD